MDYYLSKDVMSDEKLRHAFNELSTNVFGLSFEKWYQEGYCSDLYLPKS